MQIDPEFQHLPPEIAKMRQEAWEQAIAEKDLDDREVVIKHHRAIEESWEAKRIRLSEKHRPSQGGIDHA